MKILVFGAGAIGQWLGGTLALGGQDVTLLARPSVCRVLRDEGLRLPQGRVTLDAVESLEDCAGRSFDWLILAVKAYDVEQALADLQGRVAAERVLAVQNGVGTDESVARVFGPERTFVGSITRAVALPSPGVVEPAPRGGMGLAPYQPGSSPGALPEALRAAGLKVVLHPDYRAMKWSKLLLNMLGNALGAILDLEPRRLFRDGRLYRVEILALREAVHVVEAQGLEPVDLPDYPVKLMIRVSSLPTLLSFPLLSPRMARGRGDKRPSLLLDLLAGRPRSEVSWLNGAVARQARALGLAAPVNAFLTRVLEAIVAGAIPWERYRWRPEAFLADLKACRRQKCPD